MKNFYHSVRSSVRVALLIIFAHSMGVGPAYASADCASAKVCAAEAINAGNVDLAYELLLPVAKNGDAESQVSIALILASGSGTAEAKLASKERREMLALPWIRLAAIGSNRQAINWLADGYKFGWFGLKMDLAKETCLREVSRQKKSAAPCL